MHILNAPNLIVTTPQGILIGILIGADADRQQENHRNRSRETANAVQGDGPLGNFPMGARGRCLRGR
jgi:hypothetical protein